MKRYRESSELAGMIRRMSRAMVRRAGEGDLEALEALRQMELDIEAAIKDAAAALHDGPDGYSWTIIGEVCGCSRQNARQRFS